MCFGVDTGTELEEERAGGGRLPSGGLEEVGLLLANVLRGDFGSKGGGVFILDRGWRIGGETSSLGAGVSIIREWLWFIGGAGVRKAGSSTSEGDRTPF